MTAIFVFNFLPYLAYKSKIKGLQKYGKCSSKLIEDNFLWKLSAFNSIMFLSAGALMLFNENYFSAVIDIILGVLFIISAIFKFKRFKESL